MGDLPLIDSSYRDLVEYEKMKKEAKAKETWYERLIEQDFWIFK